MGVYALPVIVLFCHQCHIGRFECRIETTKHVSFECIDTDHVTVEKQRMPNSRPQRQRRELVAYWIRWPERTIHRQKRNAQTLI